MFQAVGQLTLQNALQLTVTSIVLRPANLFSFRSPSVKVMPSGCRFVPVIERLVRNPFGAMIRKAKTLMELPSASWTS